LFSFKKVSFFPYLIRS